MEWPIKSFRGNSLGSNSYVIFTETGTIVIDASSPDDSAFKQVIHYLQEFPGLTPRPKTIYLFLTHAHHRHASATTIFRKKFTSVEVFAHVDTASKLNDASLATETPASIPFHCDHVITSTEPFDFGNYTLRALPLTGHCEGHLSFILTNLDKSTTSYNKKYLFLGDLLLKSGLPKYSQNDSSVSKLIHSLRRASDLDFMIAYPGHGPALVRRQFVSTAALTLIDLISRDDTILNYLSTPRSTDEICQHVFDWLLRIGESYQSCLIMTQHHLRKLLEETRLQNEDDLWVISEV